MPHNVLLPLLRFHSLGMSLLASIKTDLHNRIYSQGRGLT